MGGTLQSTYVTMGAYDVVAIVDALSDKSMAKMAITLGQAGNVHITTLRAFSDREAVNLIEGL